MANDLSGNPLVFDTAGGWYPADGCGSMKSVIFSGGMGTSTAVVIHDAQNITHNPNMLHWSNGTSAAPDGWSITGDGATIARESAIFHNDPNLPSPSQYSAKLTRVGTDAYLTQNLLTHFGLNDVRKDLSWWKGRTIVSGMWVYATVNTRAYVESYDGVTTESSGPHTGDSTWQWLGSTSVTTVNAAATELTIRSSVRNDNTSAYFTEALIYEARPLVKMTSTGNAQAIVYPERVPFDGLHLLTLTGGMVEVEI